MPSNDRDFTSALGWRGCSRCLERKECDGSGHELCCSPIACVLPLFGDSVSREREHELCEGDGDLLSRSRTRVGIY